jgi:hypothetical protein
VENRNIFSKTDYIYSGNRPKSSEFELMESPLSDHRILIAKIDLDGFNACKN